MATNKALLLAIFSLLFVSSALANNCIYNAMVNVGAPVPGGAVATVTVIGDSGRTVVLPNSVTLVAGTNNFGPSGNSQCFRPCQVRLVITGTGTVIINTITVTKTLGSHTHTYTISGTPVNLALPANQVIGTCN